MKLDIRPKAGCRFDLVALGEVMLRLDPGEGRISTTRTFHAWEGGGEYNVARGLRRCFRLDTAVVTALADNAVGALVEDLMLQGGVDPSYVRWVPYDGVGRAVRNGLNFTERGFGLRGGLGCSDRGHTATSQLKPGDVDWDRVFGRDGARWFHTGGIFAGLSPTTAEVAEEAIGAARRHGTIVSFDLNYRDSIWKGVGGKAKAREVLRRLAARVDVLIGNEEDYSSALGFDVAGCDPSYAELDVAGYGRMLEEVARAFPELALLAATLRTATTASRNDWGALGYADGRIVTAKTRRDLAIFDRIGGGDSFASGLIYGILTGRPLEWALECGVAHGALAMTTPGDTSMARLSEVERVMAGQGSRVDR